MAVNIRKMTLLDVALYWISHTHKIRVVGFAILETNLTNMDALRLLCCNSISLLELLWDRQLRIRINLTGWNIMAILVMWNQNVEPYKTALCQLPLSNFNIAVFFLQSQFSDLFYFSVLQKRLEYYSTCIIMNDTTAYYGNSIDTTIIIMTQQPIMGISIVTQLCRRKSHTKIRIERGPIS